MEKDQSDVQNASWLSWTKPTTAYHAHFDCFSGAAGDMLLAASLDASGKPKQLAEYVTKCLSMGIPELANEFSIEYKKVTRGQIGSIAGLHVDVQSKYHHYPVAVPNKRQKINDPMENGSSHEHNHSHSHEHIHSHEHSRQHEPEKTSSSHNHIHSHDHKQSLSSPKSAPNNNSTRRIKGPLRNFSQIKTMILNASDEYISSWVKSMAINTFYELACAEARTHGVNTIDSVHFHEVGAIDSIVDTIGTLIALDCLHVTTVTCSRLPIGEGTVWTAHGCLPVPAPATLRLLIDMPTCPGPLGVVTGELVTPTGAALLRTLTKNCPPPRNTLQQHDGRPPDFTIRKIGIGAGTKDFEKHPNILRLILGDNLLIKK